MTIPSFNIHAAAEKTALDLGTPSQRERWSANLLPEEEMLAIVRAELFKPFDGFEKYNARSNRPSGTIRAIDVRHENDCGYRRGRDEALDDYTTRLANYNAIRFECTEADELDKLEWEVFKKVTVVASNASQHAWIDVGKGFDVEPRAHIATCTMCAAEVYKVSARVSVVWAGRTLTREYLVSPVSFSRAFTAHGQTCAWRPEPTAPTSSTPARPSPPRARR